MVETKTLTLGLEEVEPPVEEPIFIFAAYGPPIDTREIFPVGAPWPSVTKTYEEGESVYVHYAVKNTGAGPGVGTIKVTDLDTGTVKATYTTPTLNPGERFKTTGNGAYIGKMPNKDWRLSFKITP
jgi:hypothetical protein